MTDEHGFMAAGGPIVARGPLTFHVESADAAATRAYFDNATPARRRQDLPWKPIGQLRREDLHRLLDEWLDAIRSA